MSDLTFLYDIFFAYLQPQPQSLLLSKSQRSGGKNSSTGKLMRSKRSQGLSSVAPTHSFCGMQKSYAGISSITRRSRRIIENMPKETNTRFCSPPRIRLSPNTRQTDSGMLAISKSSSQQQQQLSDLRSTTFAPSAIGSTTSTTAVGMFVLRHSWASNASSYYLILDKIKI